LFKINKEYYKKYSHISKQTISKEVRNKFIKYLIDHGFFDLQNEYTCQTSCTSELVVSLSLNGKSKKNSSQDYLQGCPRLLKYIEKEIVIMHKKGLKRIFLLG